MSWAERSHWNFGSMLTIDLETGHLSWRLHHEFVWSQFFVSSKEVALEGFVQDTFGKGGGHMFVVFTVFGVVLVEVW